jgi:hypothetical protein
MIVAPGFISLRIWALVHPSRHVSFTESLYEAVFYGVLNYFAVVAWFPSLAAEFGDIFQIIASVFSLVVTPILLPVLWKYVLSLLAKKRKIINPIPKAWDVFFGRRQRCFMIVHLKNGQAIGGLYAYDSSASSYPEDSDLYLEQVWNLDDEGKFLTPVDGTMGLWVDCNGINYIEFFHIVEEGVKHGK